MNCIDWHMSIVSNRSATKTAILCRGHQFASSNPIGSMSIGYMNIQTRAVSV